MVFYTNTIRTLTANTIRTPKWPKLSNIAPRRGAKTTPAFSLPPPLSVTQVAVPAQENARRMRPPEERPNEATGAFLDQDNDAALPTAGAGTKACCAFSVTK